MPPRGSTKRKATGKAQGGSTKKAAKKQQPPASKKSSKPPQQGPLSDLSADDKSRIINYLLGDEAWALAYPPIEPGKGEVDLPAGQQVKKAPPPPPAQSDAAQPSGQETLVYPSLDFTPYQSLVCSYLLSKPISHRLGLRTIATMFNPPFSHRTPKSLEEAGYEGRRSVLWEARTQHKEKTASQLGDLLEGIEELCDGEEDKIQLGTLKGEAERVFGMQDGGRIGAKEALLAQLTEIKGVGNGVCEIFLRRIQHQWPVFYPYADARCLQFAHELGLIETTAPTETPAKYTSDEDEVLLKGADELRDVMVAALQNTGGEEQERRNFVRLLDALIGLGLEKQLDVVKKQVKAGETADLEKDEEEASAANGKEEKVEAEED